MVIIMDSILICEMITKPFLAIITISIAATAGLLWVILSTEVDKAYGQNVFSPRLVGGATPSPLQIVSTYLPLTGQISKGSYIHLMDLKPFNVVKGDLAMQVPCDYKGYSKVTIIGGIPPNFKTFNIGKAIGNANLDGKPVLHLSVKGVSCLYDAVIPAGVTNIALINTSGQDLNFSQAGGKYAVTLTAQIS
jgi:hypothetical protein